VQQDTTTPLLPCGFILKIVIWSSWGDDFYVGLAGLEVHDAAVGRVRIAPERVSAEPFTSVAQLPSMHGDARTPDKLVRCDPAAHAALRIRDGKETGPVSAVIVIRARCAERVFLHRSMASIPATRPTRG
jgi:Domain of unknown function (DUF4457)